MLKEKDDKTKYIFLSELLLLGMILMWGNLIILKLTFYGQTKPFLTFR